MEWLSPCAGGGLETRVGSAQGEERFCARLRGSLPKISQRSASSPSKGLWLWRPQRLGDGGGGGGFGNERTVVVVETGSGGAAQG